MKTSGCRFSAVCFLLLVGLQRAVFASQADDEMAVLVRQARAFEWSPLNPDRSDAQGAGWAAAHQADGTWADIDYTDQTRNFWKTEAHLKRTLAMAALYAEQQRLGRGDPRLLAAALLAAHVWITHDYHNPNWWQNEIAVAGDMAKILLLIGGQMQPEDEAGALTIASRATISMTGQNRVWKAGIVFRRALAQGDGPLARQARDAILGELRITGSEGLQADESFHQHGPQPQMGNYGLHFATEMTGWAQMWAGTAMALPEEKLALLRGFLIHGEGAITANGAMDISGLGRQLYPGAAATQGGRVLALLKAMASADGSHAAEYEDAGRQGAQPLGSGTGNGGGESLNLNFYRSDWMIHRRPAFYASVKLCSSRVIGEEMTNNENLKGRYLSDGALFLYQDCREYTDIFPVLDWGRVPGVTCSGLEHGLMPAGKMQTDYAGGVSSGLYGAEGLDYSRDGVTGRKGWFFLDDAVVCLGAGLSGTDLRTSVDQRLAQGETRTPAGVAGVGIRELKGAQWVLNGSEGYLFDHPQDIRAGVATQEGAWSDIYSSGSPTRVSKAVFSIWIQHPESAGAAYSYMLIPGATEERMRACASHLPARIIRNTADIQAVQDVARGITEVLFYAPGKLQIDAHTTVSVNAPCAVLLTPGGDYAADPAQKLSRLALTLSGRDFSLALPQGQQAGSGVAFGR